ncbi:acetolactate synthase [Streptomyces bambusae]|uniref:Acetolactate synthase n=1 Tax=Streptomyces bambusae TaxID=1550616 RepID=A0ABS6YY28_9ACTN|nr:acetolactate synthase [Streptomyces bambusae]
MTTMTGGRAVARALAAHGVGVLFGIPGTHNLEVYAHLRPYGVHPVTTRHEQGAAYAADGYARTSGRPGVVLTTTGPGLLNTVAAVGQAYSDSVPLLVLSPGMPLRHPALPTGRLHETPGQQRAMEAVTAFSHRVTSVGEIDTAVARAFTSFRTGRPRPVHIEIPLDLLEESGPVTTRPRRTAPAAPARADAGELLRAAHQLRRAGRTALVVGGGARAAGPACTRLAELLGAPVVTTANGKGTVAESHPLSLGVALHTGTVQKWLADCDTVVAVGTELAESDFWRPPPAPGGVLIRIDIDPDRMYADPPADIPLTGDAATVLDDLLRHVAEPPRAPVAVSDSPASAARALGSGPAPVPGPVRPPVALADRLRRSSRAEHAARDARWVPYLDALRGVLATDAVITSDSAMACYYGALPHMPLDPPGRMLHPTGFGTLGYALPAAVGAATARPDRQVVALSGDGGLQFTVQELATAAQLDRPLPVVVFDNGGYGEIRNQMEARGAAPVAVDLPSPDLPALARAYGGNGAVARTPRELAAALATALCTPGPTVIVVPEETRA